MTPQLQFPVSVRNATTNGNQFGNWATGITQQVTTPPTANMGSAVVPDTPAGINTAPQMRNNNFWSKDGGANMLLGGVHVLCNLWAAYQARKMAKEQMAFARGQWNTNLANQTKTYNTALEDRIRGRYAAGDRTENQIQSEIDRHSL